MKIVSKRIVYPSSRIGWHRFYASKFSKDPTNNQAEHLACWYLLLHLALDPKKQQAGV